MSKISTFGAMFYDMLTFVPGMSVYEELAKLPAKEQLEHVRNAGGVIISLDDPNLFELAFKLGVDTGKNGRVCFLALDAETEAYFPRRAIPDAALVPAAKETKEITKTLLLSMRGLL